MTDRITELPYSEIDRIEPMWRELTEYNAATSTHFADYFRSFTFTTRKSFMDEKIAHGAVIRTFWVEDIGFCTINYDLAAHMGAVEMLYVRPTARGGGWGRKLMDAGLAALREQGIARISIEVAFGNANAFSFYEKYGFAPFTVNLLPSDIAEEP